jgi:hypothetical protein
MNTFFFLAQTGEYTLVSGGAAVIGALTGAVTYLWRRAEREFDECKKDRAKLWQAIAELQTGEKKLIQDCHIRKEAD